MANDVADWITAETPLDDWAPPGALSASARAVAISNSIPLISTYFASGQGHSLTTQPALRLDPDRSDASLLHAALRVRVALAAADRLLSLLERIAARPNFRYDRLHETQVGLLRGRLDWARYVAGQGRVAHPPTFPVVTVNRAEVTPENTLAVYAGRWLLQELTVEHVATLLPRSGPERRAIDLSSAALRRRLALPAFAACLRAAREVERRDAITGLLDRVEVRLTGGHVGNPTPYWELHDWVRASMDGAPGADAGELDWAFYGDTFDSKLFEIWVLGELIKRLSAALRPPISQRSLGGPGTEPIATWESMSGTVALHFQRAVPSLLPSRVGRWKHDDQPLRGIPDISLVVKPTVGNERLVLVDPKLRQRHRTPTEELYKMLGYFENFGFADEGRGVIVTYWPASRGTLQPRTFTTERGGMLVAAAVDPTAPGAVATWHAVLSPVFDALGVTSFADAAPSAVRTAAPAAGGPDCTEEQIASEQARAVEELRSIAQRLGDDGLRPWVHQLEAVFPITWQALAAEVREMMVTAVFVGNILTDARDFSGPVLGVSAAAEYLLWHRLVMPASDRCHRLKNRHMLGQMLFDIQAAVRNPNTDESRAIAAVIAADGLDGAALGKVADGLMDVNRSYRRPAAHRTVVGRQAWLTFYGVMLLRNQPLLPALADVLRLAPPA